MPNKIKEIRVKKHWTQGRLALAAGIPRPNVSEIESGIANPTLETMFKICLALGVSIGEIYGHQSAPVEEISLEDKRILHQLHDNGIATLGHVTHLINIYKLMRSETPLPRQIVPRAEELRDAPEEKPTLPDWAEKQLEEKKKTHKHAGKDRDKGK